MTNDAATGTRVVFPERGRVVLERFDVPDVGPTQVLLRTSYSLMSSGTERTVLHGRFDAGTHWEGYARYPFYPGYSSVGEIVALGDEVRKINEGREKSGGLLSRLIAQEEAPPIEAPPGGADVEETLDGESICHYRLRLAARRSRARLPMSIHDKTRRRCGTISTPHG